MSILNKMGWLYCKFSEKQLRTYAWFCRLAGFEKLAAFWDVGADGWAGTASGQIEYMVSTGYCQRLTESERAVFEAIEAWLRARKLRAAHSIADTAQEIVLHLEAASQALGAPPLTN